MWMQGVGLRKYCQSLTRIWKSSKSTVISYSPTAYAASGSIIGRGAAAAAAGARVAGLDMLFNLEMVT